MGRLLSLTRAPWTAAAPGVAFARGMAAWLAAACTCVAIAALASQAIWVVAERLPAPWGPPLRTGVGRDFAQTAALVAAAA